MVKVQAPALSLEASGSIAGAMVFSRWKGRPYVRSLVIPANPRSAGQVSMRAMLKFVSQQWNGLSAPDKATWEDRAAAGNYSPFNAYVSYNQFRWRDFLAPTMAFPEGTAMTPPVLGAGSAVAGVRSITVTQPITTANDGWGVAFFRNPTGVFTSTWDKMRHVGAIVGTADVIFVDSPLDPGTYYYEMRSITEDGQLSAATAEVNATVS